MALETLNKVNNDFMQAASDSKLLIINKKNQEISIFDKNKKEITYWEDFNKNGKYDTKIVVSGEKNAVSFKLDENKNNTTQIQQRLWKQIIDEKQQELVKQFDIEKKFGIKINQKIDCYKQNPKEGDCWLLGGLSIMSLTDFGANTIKNSISQNKDTGNVTVSLKGVNESYTFSPDEIITAKKRLSSGDDNVRAIEMAIEQHRLKLIKSGEGKRKTKDFSKSIGEGTLEDPLNGGAYPEAVFLLTGEILCKTYNNSFINKLLKKSQDVDNIVSKFQNNKGKYAIGVLFGADSGMANDHAHFIVEMNKDYVMVVNPWDTSEAIQMERADFDSAYEDLFLFGKS